MGMTVGMPVVKLDIRNHFGKADKHSGNAKAVLDEMLPDKKTGYRHCSDADYDKEKTANNRYYRFDGDAVCKLDSAVYASDVYEQWTSQADSYRVVDKNGKSKKLRSDAGIGFAGIIKPTGDQMSRLSYDEQLKFCEHSIMCIQYIYKKRGMTLDYAVIHTDEKTMHVHYCGHDEQYRLGKKLGLKLYDALNKTEYPVLMKKVYGWDIDALQGYDTDAVKDMTKEEKKQYNLEYRKKRKEHGLSSSEYKVKQEQEKKRLQKENEELQAENERLKAENEQSRALQIKNNHLHTDNERLKADNEYLKQQIDEKERYLQNMTDTQILRAAERIKQKQSKDAASKQRVEQSEQIINNLPRRSGKQSVRQSIDFDI